MTHSKCSVKGCWKRTPFYSDLCKKHRDEQDKKNEPVPIKVIREKLLDTLDGLRVEFVSRTKEWADKEFTRLEGLYSRRETDWWDAYGLKWEAVEQRPRGVTQRNIDEAIRQGNYQNAVVPRLVSGSYNTKDYARYHRAYEKLRTTILGGRNRFIEKAGKDAQHHYEVSVEKLARRIATKNLRVETLRCSTSKVRENIETEITDGTGAHVRAWTIIASGPIQRPHYRYLVH